MNEIWKDIPNYQGIYQVSSLGRVKSLKFGKEKIMKLSKNTTGYYKISLLNGGNRKQYQIHQLVAMAFLNHNVCGYKLVVDHKNDNPLDNRVENLQLVSQRFNVCKTQGVYSSQFKGVGWDKNANKWKAQYFLNGKSKHLGLFDCELKAHHTYLQAVKELEQKKGRN